MTTNTNAALREFAEGRIHHLNRGQCPDIVAGHDSRDPDCPVCAALTTAAAVPAASRHSEYPPLPEPDATTVGLGAVWNRHSMRAYVDAARALRAQAAPAAVAVPSKAVAYLDIGSGGYLDIGTDLDDEELLKLPSGRHMLAIVGTFGVDGYTPAAVAGEPVAPDFYTACALYKEGGEAGWIPLPGYSNETEHGVKHLVLESARKEGYKGTADGRLVELGWEIRPVYLTPQPTNSAPAAQGDAEDAARYRWLIASCESDGLGYWLPEICLKEGDLFPSKVEADTVIDAARKQGDKP